MLNTVNEIAALLKDTFLAQREIIVLDAPDCDLTALAIQINQGEIFEAWQLLRSHVSTTQRWPVVVATWNWDGQQRDWPTDMADANFLDRQAFRGEHAQTQIAHYLPDTIIARSQDVDLDAFLAEEAANQRRLVDAHVLKEDIDYEIGNIPEQFDRSSIQSQLLSSVDRNELQSTLDLEKWLLDWEIAHGIGIAPPMEEEGYLSWYEPDSEQSLALNLLPTVNSWESVVYLHWYGSESAGSETVTAFLKRWHQRYGAELVCHYGTMLQLVVNKKPATLWEAFDLAWEQTAIAPCTTLLPGISLRNHARELMACDRWFLHERP